MIWNKDVIHEENKLFNDIVSIASVGGLEPLIEPLCNNFLLAGNSALDGLSHK